MLPERFKNRIIRWIEFFEINQDLPKTNNLPNPILPSPSNNNWIRASYLRNFALDDPLVDYLMMYGKFRGLQPDSKTYIEELDFTTWIMNQGNKFEDNIMNYLRSRIEVNEVPKGTQHIDACNQTISWMKEGKFVISQARLWNPQNETYGSPDLLIRSDKINTLFISLILEYSKGCRFSSDWHYRVVDIKFSTLKLEEDATRISDFGSQAAYKLQLTIYNQALGYIQDYTPSRAYLLGRGWTTTIDGKRWNCGNPWERLGVIDFERYGTELEKRVADGIAWHRRLLKEGDKWDPLSLDIYELCPNMKRVDSGWDICKKDLAIKRKEITLLPCVEVKEREKCWKLGIKTWDNNKITPQLLFLAGKAEDQMIAVLNAQNGEEKLFPTINQEEWKQKMELVLFTDSINSTISLSDNSVSCLWIISCGKLQDESEIKQWSVKSIEEEGKILYEWLSWVGQEMLLQKKNSVVLWTFGKNKNQLENLVEKYIKFNVLTVREKNIWNRIHWEDYYSLILDQNIAIKGCFNLSLRTLIFALSERGLIQNNYKDCLIQNEKAVSMAFIRCLEKGNFENEHIRAAHAYIAEDCRSLIRLLSISRC